MNTKKFSDAMGEIDTKYVDEALNYKKKNKKPGWMKWGAMAACLCLVIVGIVSISNWQNNPHTEYNTAAQVYTLPQAEKLSVELVEWGGDHFKAIVVDAEDNSIFPVGAELSVVFDYETEILLDDGTLMVFNPDEPDTEIIGWEVGTMVSVEFLNYEEYREGNHFYNRLYASHVEVEKDADPNEPEEIVISDSITFTGTITDNVIESLVPVILVDVDENSELKYDKVLFELIEEQEDWEARVGTRVQIVCSDFFEETLPPVGSLISITEVAPDDRVKAAEEAGRAYYSNTVFEVISLELQSRTENEIIFSVCVSKGGEVQEPNRTITLQLNNGTWEVINEGY